MNSRRRQTIERGAGGAPVRFVHLHTHTTFSFGDGACRIPELVMRAAELGMPALAVTDHEGLYGAVRFYQACKAAGIKPIVGVELTVEPAVGPGGRVWEPGADGGPPGGASAAHRRRPGGRGGARRAAPAAPRVRRAALAPDGRIAHLKAAATVPPSAARASGAGGYHLVLLAKDYAGWSNLCRIISAAHLEHPGEPPVARLATLAEHSGHLVALSGCRRGEVWSRLLAGDKAGARAAASVFHRIFGREYFIELQHELLPDSDVSLRALDLLAHELRIPTVATGDVHYTVKGDAGLHDVLAAEAANQPLPNPLGRKNAELYLKSPGQMRRLFQRYPEAYANAGRIAARCNLDLGLGRLLFPAYPLPPGETAFSLLWKRCFEGAAERYRPLTAEVTARLERELKVVEELGFAEYFLAVRDIVEFALGRGIYYSGRGSAGNSIVSYVLRITDADPIANELLFERFLNPTRREMPDVDIDFCSARRDEVIQYIYERFGHDKVAMVATVNTVRAPSAVRIVSRAFGFTPEEINGLSRRVPWGSAAKLGEMLAERPELADHEFQHPHYRRLVDVAERLVGVPRPPRHAPGRVHPLARPAHRPRAAAVGGQGRRGGPVRQGRRRDAGPRQDGHPRAQDALGHRRGGAPHRGAHRRARQRLGAPARRPQGVRAHPLGAHRRPVPARELGAAQPGHAAAGARLRGRHRGHLALPPGAAAGRHDRAVHQAAARQASRSSCRTPPWSASCAAPTGSSSTRSRSSRWRRPWPASASPRPTCCAAP